MGLLLRGGDVIDGTGRPRRRLDVRVDGDRIVEVGPGLSPSGQTILDASGLAVAPGFIDTHSHADGGLIDAPDAGTQIRQGIATAIVGQDGGSHVPLAEWLAQVDEKRPAINVASFVGHGAVRKQILGEDFRRPSRPEEIRRMRGLVAQEMKAGALGLSSGIEYDPGIYATTEELIALAEIAGVYGGLYISHVRDEEEGALDSFDELIRIAEEGRLPAQISHIKLGAAPVWGKTRAVFDRIEAALRRGLDITADVYPYTFWQSGLAVLLTDRVWDDLRRWEKGLALVGGGGNVRIMGYKPDPSVVGKTLAEIARVQQRTDAQQAMEMMRRANGEVGVAVTAMQERDLKAFIAHPRIMFCSDGGLRGSHPRGAGTYPRLLGRYVREQRVLSLEEAVRKASALPAARMRLPDRGLIAPGKKADLVIFDPATIADRASIEEPQAPPVGVRDVIVNGAVVLRDGRLTGERSGRALRRG